MANALYDKGREKFLGHATIDLDWINDTIRAFLVDATDYTPNLATHEFLSDIPAAGRIGGAGGGTAFGDGVVLASKTATNGVADAADIVFTAVTGDQAEYLVIYKAITSDAASPLICLIDTATGLPVTPNGADITVVFDNGANKIFKL